MKDKLKQKESAGLVIIYRNMILMGHPTNSPWWKSYSIPKGGIEKGESKLDAAIRETREEVGINVPLNLIDKTEYSFSLISKKHKYYKNVYYFIVRIDELSQLGLVDIKVPKNQLRLKEMDWGGFLTLDEARKRCTPSQTKILDNLVSLNIFEYRLPNFDSFSHIHS